MKFSLLSAKRIRGVTKDSSVARGGTRVVEIFIVNYVWTKLRRCNVEALPLQTKFNARCKAGTWKGKRWSPLCSCSWLRPWWDNLCNVRLFHWCSATNQAILFHRLQNVRTLGSQSRGLFLTVFQTSGILYFLSVWKNSQRKLTVFWKTVEDGTVWMCPVYAYIDFTANLPLWSRGMIDAEYDSSVPRISFWGYKF